MKGDTNMPTGYTAKIYDGEKVSSKDFLMTCAREFGACITMRDEPLSKPIPNKFEPSKFYENELKKSQAELEHLKNMTIQDIKNAIDKEYLEQVEKQQEKLSRIRKLKDAYEKVYDEVKMWNPPTTEHESLKEFALKQLADSIYYDCDTSYYEREIIKDSKEEWFNKKIQKTLDNIKYCAEEYKKEIQRVNSRNKWLKELRDSLEGMGNKDEE